jgi:hypothetical protein
LEEGVWRSCFTANVSVTGIFVQSSRIPKVDRIELEIFVTDDRPVKLVGQMVRGARVPSELLRVAKGGFAVKLLEAPPEWYEYCLALGG